MALGNGDLASADAHGTSAAEVPGMTMKLGARKLKVTVGDLIAAVFDVAGDQVDQVVDLLRFDDMKRQIPVVVEGDVPPRVP